MIDLVDQSAEAHTVAQKDKLILVFSALLARTGQKLHCLRPFGVRELGFACEGMKMRNERSDKLEGARIFAKAPVQFLDATAQTNVNEGCVQMNRFDHAHWSVMV